MTKAINNKSYCKNSFFPIEKKILVDPSEKKRGII